MANDIHPLSIKFCLRLLNKSSILILSLGISVLITERYLRSYRRKKILRNKICDKRKAREENVEIVRRALYSSSADVRAKREKIVNLEFDQLRILLSNNTFTPTEVLEAFQSRALTVHDYTNCVCEFLLETKVWVEELEKNFSQSKHKPLLYGIPISIKECFKVKGHDATIGFAQFLNQPAEQDSFMITVLKSLGAVPFVRTNIPQSMKSLGCSNPIYGLTTNPHDPSRSCGGSSGGEGALISLKGSPLGLGTDIGGSVRVPSHFCGICSLKPTAARLDQRGRRGAVPGVTAVHGTAGPMANSVEGIVWFLRAVCSFHPKSIMFSGSPYTVPLPFNEQLFSNLNKMRIGFYDYDGFLEATPACKRAVQEAKTTLEILGHSLISFEPPDVPELISLYLASVVPDGGSYLANVFNNDIVDEKQQELVDFMNIPLKLKLIIGKLLSFFNKKNSAIPYLSYAQNTLEMRQVFQMLNEYKERFAALWMNASLDCVICPVLACSALPVDLPSKLFRGGGSYSILYNALDFPSGVVPVCTVTEKDEQDLEQYLATDNMSTLIKVGSKGSTGLPVGVQVVALPFREEVCLRVMKILEDNLKIKVQ